MREQETKHEEHRTAKPRVLLAGCDPEPLAARLARTSMLAHSLAFLSEPVPPLKRAVSGFCWFCDAPLPERDGEDQPACNGCGKEQDE